ncbi:MAG: hypothetical protein EB000_04300 [Alphaproteobacteria bacterium]|nr:hypothetical protein [Alphaproteobacteria bacterium]
MCDEKNIEITKSNASDDTKARMLAALSKKQKGQTAGKSSGLTSGSKIKEGQTVGKVPKMHRRKAGSA